MKRAKARVRSKRVGKGGVGAQQGLGGGAGKDIVGKRGAVFLLLCQQRLVEMLEATHYASIRASHFGLGLLRRLVLFRLLLPGLVLALPPQVWAEAMQAMQARDRGMPGGMREGGRRARGERTGKGGEGKRDMQDMDGLKKHAMHPICVSRVRPCSPLLPLPPSHPSPPACLCAPVYLCACACESGREEWREREGTLAQAVQTEGSGAPRC